MRTILNIDDEKARKLDLICKKLEISRSEAIRKGIDCFLEKINREGMDSFFGLWAKKGLDGLNYQIAIRQEWGEDE